MKVWLSIDDLSSNVLDEKIGERDANQLREDVELIDGVYGELNAEDYLQAKLHLFFLEVQ